MAPDPILDVQSAVTLIGGSDVAVADLNTCLLVAPSLVAADGGANHLVQADLTPKAVIGDLDSLSDPARARFADVLHLVEEQDTTDFEKCLTRIRAPLILAPGFLGGRLDHTLATLAVLARLQALHVILIGAEDICLLLPQGRTVLDATPGHRIALMPLGDAVVSSAGLDWDLDAMALSPGGAVSSSNRAAQARVTLDVQGPVLVTQERAALDDAIACVRGR